MKVLQVEQTPNPDALKFIVDEKLLQAGARSFDHPISGREDPLASALFSLGPVHTVFYMDKFVTVSKLPTADWRELQPRIVETIEAAAKPAPAPAPPAAGSDDELLQKINQVLDENVRPALANDGGGLEVLDYRDHVLTVHYQGACGSCPSAASGTLFAIQNLLQRMVDPALQVVSD
ncbi:MAG: NifU family protein [Elusimicrobiota bacterium]|jgi:NFU1 iron-sulfur cluster scaffold homolog, mitochondrial